MTGQEILEHFLKLGIQPSTHLFDGKAAIVLKFENAAEFTKIIKDHGGRWRKSVNGWYIPRSKPLLLRILNEIAALRDLDIQRKELKSLIRQLELKNYSKSTIKNYSN